MNGGPLAELTQLQLPDEARDVAGLGPVLRFHGAGPRAGGSQVVAELHGPPSRQRLQLPTRDAAAESLWTRVWVQRLQTYAPPATGERAHGAVKRVARLLTDAPTDLVPVHADLHDGQVFAGRGGTIGVVDWDSFALGEAATDLANPLVHLELRVLAL